MWSRKHKECTRCHTTERKHKARGLCKRCYGSCFDKNVNERSKRSRDKIFFGGNRLKALKRDKYCTICKLLVQDQKGRRQGVVHHIDLNPKNNDMINLVVMCQRCHSKLHKYFRLRDYFKDSFLIK